MRRSLKPARPHIYGSPANLTTGWRLTKATPQLLATGAALPPPSLQATTPPAVTGS
ncbi:hypothetical protein [Streptomyces sp. NPDC013740]|uniref:hypothetical protein n=1 Tax=Streptomyces sp. NPDC013740 TaxID=3364867 RepID=UPI0036F5356B